MKTFLSKKVSLVLAACCLTASSLPLCAAQHAIQLITDRAPASPAYSQGVQAGDFVFVAGQIGMNATGVLVGETIEEQTAQALENIKMILAAQDLTFDDVVKTQIFLKDVKDFAVVNNLYMQAFTGNVKPARTTVIGNLPKDALIEIECTAYSPETVDDKGLEQISQTAHNLREIYLEGASEVTDTGITSLVDKLPNLKLIDLSSYTLGGPMTDQKTVAPQVSDDLIQTLSGRGIIVIQNNRTPWF